MVGATSQLDPSSLTPLYVASCGRLQLEVPHLATSVDYCMLLIINVKVKSSMAPGHRRFYLLGALDELCMKGCWLIHPHLRRLGTQRLGIPFNFFPYPLSFASHPVFFYLL